MGLIDPARAARSDVVHLHELDDAERGRALEAVRGVVVTVLVCFIVASRMGDGGEADARAVWTEMGPAPVVLDTEGFDPAHLIDDDVFYDSSLDRKSVV